MTTEKMSVARALTELKTIDKRLDKYFSAGLPYAAITYAKTTQIEGRSVEEFKKGVESQYYTIVSLISRRAAIKAAISKSNASTKVKFDGIGEITVAEAIEYKSSGVSHIKELRHSIAYSMNQIQSKFDVMSNQISRDCDNYIASITSKDFAADPDQIGALRKQWLEANEPSILDPIDAYKKLEAIGKYIFDFQTNVDTILSESNATTEIEIEYDIIKF